MMRCHYDLQLSVEKSEVLISQHKDDFSGSDDVIRIYYDQIDSLIKWLKESKKYIHGAENDKEDETGN